MSAIGPLTTPFVPPSSCLAKESFVLRDQGNPQSLYRAPPIGSCMPPGYTDASGYYYSPGVCPQGYTQACAIGGAGAIGGADSTTTFDIIATCCPSGFQCGGNDLYGCQSTFATWQGVYTWEAGGPQTGVSTGLITSGVLEARSVVVHSNEEETTPPISRSSDNGASITSSDNGASMTGTGSMTGTNSNAASSSTGTSGGNNSGGNNGGGNDGDNGGTGGSGSNLSTGAAAGIGVGATVALVLIISAIWYAYRRGRRAAVQDSRSTAVETKGLGPAAMSEAEVGTPGPAELHDRHLLELPDPTSYPVSELPGSPGNRAGVLPGGRD